jgi:hypothetical protein
MRRLFLAAIAALSLFPAPALADPATQAWIRRATVTLQRGGVGTYVREDCPPGFLAKYVIPRREIHLCPLAVAHGWPVLKEAIAHEAIHAAQHCNGDIMGETQLVPLIYFWASHSPNDPKLAQFMNVLRDTYRRKGHQIDRSVANRGDRLLVLETEAYALEGTPDEAMEIFAAFCIS